MPISNIASIPWWCVQILLLKHFYFDFLLQKLAEVDFFFTFALEIEAKDSE